MQTRLEMTLEGDERQREEEKRCLIGEPVDGEPWSLEEWVGRG